MAGRVLDTGEISRLLERGWSKEKISARFGVTIRSINHSLSYNVEGEDPETLRARWATKLPAMKEAIRAEVLSCRK